MVELTKSSVRSKGIDESSALANSAPELSVLRLMKSASLSAGAAGCFIASIDSVASKVTLSSLKEAMILPSSNGSCASRSTSKPSLIPSKVEVTLSKIAVFALRKMLVLLRDTALSKVVMIPVMSVLPAALSSAARGAASSARATLCAPDLFSTICTKLSVGYSPNSMVIASEKLMSPS